MDALSFAHSECSGSEAGSYLRLIYCVYHSTLGLIVIKGATDRLVLFGVEDGRVELGPLRMLHLLNLQKRVEGRSRGCSV